MRTSIYLAILAALLYVGVAKAEVIDTDNYATVQSLIEQNKTFVVIYRADWCGYCHKMEPEIRQIEQELGITLVIFDATFKEAPGIWGVPTTDIYVKGGVKKRFVGLTNKLVVKQWIEELIK